MKTNGEIINENLDLIRTCVECQFAKLKDKQFMDDFHHDLIIILSEYDNEKMNDALENNHFNALVSRIIINQVWSKTSKFYKDYYRFQNRADDISDLITKEDDDNPHP